MYRLLYWLVLRRLPPEGTHHVSFALLRVLVALPGVAGMMQRLFAPRAPELRVHASRGAQPDLVEAIHAGATVGTGVENVPIHAHPVAPRVNVAPQP